MFGQHSDKTMYRRFTDTAGCYEIKNKGQARNDLPLYLAKILCRCFEDDDNYRDSYVVVDNIVHCTYKNC